MFTTAGAGFADMLAHGSRFLLWSALQLRKVRKWASCIQSAVTLWYIFWMYLPA